ncbi:MAG: DUF3336 domain-containing protein [Pseudomonadota bacterium]
MRIQGFRIRKLRATLHSARTYEEWQESARELDRLEGRDLWREAPASPHYKYELIRRHTDEMRAFRDTANVYRLLDLLHESLGRNLGDVANPALYDVALSGTKHLIEEYLSEAETSLCFLCDNDFVQLPQDKKARLFRQAIHSLGRPALMLSGGSTLGLFHLGVVKALWENDLLPRVICGSSMGAVVAAGTCTRTDEELDLLMEEGASATMERNAFIRLPWDRMLREKAIMDQAELKRMLKANVGDYTFGEAYERTGRILNVSVSPTRTGLRPRVLNFSTAPNVTILSAVLASCAVPGLFPPANLMARDRCGVEMPYLQNERWIDGTLRGDLPIMRLARLYNVNRSIVSQTNPHVVPFLSIFGKGRAGAGIMLGGAMAQAQILTVIDALRKKVHTTSWRPILDQIHTVLGQRYMGDASIHLPFSLRAYRKILSNPSVEDMDWFTLEGERATWGKLPLIKNLTRVSRAFESCMCRLDPSQESIQWRPL